MESYGLWNLQGTFWAGNALCSGASGERFTSINAGGNTLDSTTFSNATATQPCRPPYRNQPEYVAMKPSESVSVLPNRTPSGNVDVLPALRNELLGEHSNQESGNSNTMSLSINAQSSNTLSSPEVSTNISTKKGKQRNSRKKSGVDKSETALPVQYFNQQYNPMYSMMFGRSSMKRPESTSDESEDEEDDNDNDNNTNDIDNYSNDSSAAGSNSPQRGVLSRAGYECGQCDLVADTRPALKKHIALCHPDAHDSDEHVAHALGSKVSGSCPMPTCSYLSLTREELESHVARHVAEGFQRHAAGGAGKKCGGSAASASLQRVRYEREEYRCQICTYTCTIEKAFYKHLKLHSVGLNVSSVKISCVICGKDRPSEVEMNKHMRKHRDNRYFCCDVCIFRTVQLKKDCKKWNNLLHEEVVLLRINVLEEHSSNAAYFSKLLIQHRRMHTGEKPHLCPHCAYRSARRDNLRSHVRRVHKKENLYCDTFSPRGLLMASTNQPGSPGSQ